MMSIVFPSTYPFVSNQFSFEFLQKRKEELEQYWRTCLLVPMMTDLCPDHPISIFVDLPKAFMVLQQVQHQGIVSTICSGHEMKEVKQNLSVEVMDDSACNVWHTVGDVLCFVVESIFEFVAEQAEKLASAHSQKGIMTLNLPVHPFESDDEQSVVTSSNTLDCMKKQEVEKIELDSVSEDTLGGLDVNEEKMERREKENEEEGEEVEEKATKDAEKMNNTAIDGVRESKREEDEAELSDNDFFEVVSFYDENISSFNELLHHHHPRRQQFAKPSPKPWGVSYMHNGILGHHAGTGEQAMGGRSKKEEDEEEGKKLICPQTSPALMKHPLGSSPSALACMSFLSLFEQNLNIHHNSSSIIQIDGLQLVGFNKLNTGYTIGTNNFIRALSIDPYLESVKTNHLRDVREIAKHVHDKSELLAFVGAGRNPLFPNTHVYLWEMSTKVTTEISSRAEVLQVSLRLNRLAVVMLHMTVIYDTTVISAVSIVKEFCTVDNKNGLIYISPYNNSNVTALLAQQVGTVTIFKEAGSTTLLINAHGSAIAALSLSCDCSLLSTASTRGTRIRVFNTLTGEKLHDFKRGLSPASISCLSFNATMQLLACSSNKQTIHVFSTEGKKSLKIFEVVGKNFLCIFDDHRPRLHVLMQYTSRYYDLESSIDEGVVKLLKTSGDDED